jgi:hypothetical protein
MDPNQIKSDALNELARAYSSLNEALEAMNLLNDEDGHAFFRGRDQLKEPPVYPFPAMFQSPPEIGKAPDSYPLPLALGTVRH